MDYNEIKKLLEKYFNGNSSLSEEKILREYFLQNGNIPAEFEYARQIFLHFKNESEIKLNKPARNKTLEINTRWIIRISAIAACIIIIVGLWLIIRKPTAPTVYAYINGVPVTDKNIALSEAEKAFSVVSDNLRTGTKDLHQLSKYNKYKRFIIKSK